MFSEVEKVLVPILKNIEWFKEAKQIDGVKASLLQIYTEFSQKCRNVQQRYLAAAMASLSTVEDSEERATLVTAIEDAARAPYAREGAGVPGVQSSGSSSGEGCVQLQCIESSVSAGAKQDEENRANLIATAFASNKMPNF